MLQPPTPPPMTTAPARLFTRRSVAMRVSSGRRQRPWRLRERRARHDRRHPASRRATRRRRPRRLRAARRAHEHELQGGRRRAELRRARIVQGRRSARDRPRERVRRTPSRQPRPASAPASSPTCPSSGALVLDFIEGTTMSADDLRRGDRLREVADAIRQAARLPALPRRLQHVPRPGALHRHRAGARPAAT